MRCATTLSKFKLFHWYFDQETWIVGLQSAWGPLAQLLKLSTNSIYGYVGSLNYLHQNNRVDNQPGATPPVAKLGVPKESNLWLVKLKIYEINWWPSNTLRRKRTWATKKKSTGWPAMPWTPKASRSASTWRPSPATSQPRSKIDVISNLVSLLGSDSPAKQSCINVYSPSTNRLPHRLELQ